jgi:hypothetical protein
LPSKVSCLFYKERIVAPKKKQNKGRNAYQEFYFLNKINKRKVSHYHGHEKLQE